MRHLTHVTRTLLAQHEAARRDLVRQSQDPSLLDWERAELRMRVTNLVHAALYVYSFDPAEEEVFQ